MAEFLRNMFPWKEIEAGHSPTAAGDIQAIARAGFSSANLESASSITTDCPLAINVPCAAVRATGATSARGWQ
jgi:hypothetical protein